MHVPDVVWHLIFAGAVLAVVVFGFPYLLGGGGQLGRRRGRRGGYRVRFGPHPAVVIGAALWRRADTLLLAAASLVVLVAVIVNARA